MIAPREVPDSGRLEAVGPLAKTPAPRILLVDDEESLRDLFPACIRRAGYQVDVAADGLEAWEMFCANHYDLLVTDNDMPRLTGLGLIRRVRTIRASMPVVLTSGLVTVEQIKEHHELNFSAILVKPFLPGDLLQTIQKIPLMPMRPNAGNHSSRVQPAAVL